MKVLIISANTLPSSPSGPAYIAGAALEAGHTVEVFECLFARDLASELEEHITRFDPHVIGISIRLVTGDIIDERAKLKTKYFDVRPKIKRVTIGICLWTHHQAILNETRNAGQIDERKLFSGAYYISPELPRRYMLDLIESLQMQKSYTVQVNKPYAELW